MMRSTELFHEEGDRDKIEKLLKRRLQQQQQQLLINTQVYLEEEGLLKIMYMGNIDWLTGNISVLERQLFAIDNDVEFNVVKVKIAENYMYKPVFDDDTEVLYLLKTKGGRN